MTFLFYPTVFHLSWMSASALKFVSRTNRLGSSQKYESWGDWSQWWIIQNVMSPSSPHWKSFQLDRKKIKIPWQQTQECFTADNAPLTADAIVYLRIVNMKDACYEVFNVKNAVLNLCLTHVREEIGHLTLEEAFSSRNELNKSRQFRSRALT